MIKRASIVLAEGKPARYFITIVTASAVVATMGLNQPMALGHGGDNHDQDLGLFPAGTIRLLPDDHKIPHNDGVIGPVLPVPLAP